MTENKKKEINYHAPTVEFDNNNSIVTNIGFTAGSLEKYQIVFPIPQDDAECKDRYDCELKDLIAAGVRQLSTRPDYKGVGFYCEGEKDAEGIEIDKSHPMFGELKPDGHEAMQTLADGYKVGQRASGGPSQKVMAQKAKKAESELGMTMEEMVAKMKALKDQGLVD